MIDAKGYRANVGIILANRYGKVLWARRVGQDAWQFPQGGIKEDESPEDALYRELYEELGLERRDVAVVGRTQDWLRYTLPKRYVRRHCKPLCIGQKQLWFLLRLESGEEVVRLDRFHKPEFDAWKWVNYWDPARHVIFFKRGVYRRALHQFAPLLFAELMSPPRAQGHLDSEGAALIEVPASYGERVPLGSGWR
ncbi:MAG: RNA pyrophosphohydrolase [Gammaproteobacteria bacterium]|nr:RNA pyrophosphohydrolase [Gammaproteobacteria bacterium]NIR82847.1 RNA pyrophosphohydrolase [Gammaproteobacteria bacterium]NIR89956.1 RNA pyrophosphohydrolase [Gammaproteobacteria bacterium]NIU04005.1 RNA pyrophosphohydrolase [Gammaproteobacteria bacterium]NIV51325.1 RNA pyrophosphohydrolase [Gammaproteobacteria bacterium]